MSPPVTAAAIRGVYLWAGNATIDLHRVKFPDLAVDAAAHLHAHTPQAATQLVDMGANWTFLSMNWGFPPEREAAHWAEFTEAARHYRDAGMSVAGYVQASNCLAEGSYASRDWYARDPRGRTIPYFRGRLMTCWNHTDWIAEVDAHARRAVEAGADAVFFDNLWMGATPWTLGGVIGGFAGCSCRRCRDAFRADSGFDLPRTLRDDDASARYLEWRAGVVERRFAGWAASIRAMRTGVLVVANCSDSALRDTAALFGIDVAALAHVQDAVLIENIALPRADDRRIVGNALPVRVVRALAGDRPILTVTYDKGIGLDGPPDPRRVLRGIAELVALGAAPVLKASEYLDSAGRFTVLTCDEFAPLRARIRSLLQWVAHHADVLAPARPDPAVHVLWDAAAMSPIRSRGRAAARTHAVAQAMVAEAIPFGFLTVAQVAAGATGDRPVLVPPGVQPPVAAAPAGTRLIRIADTLDVPGAPPPWLAHPRARALLDPFLGRLARAYFASAATRRFIDRAGLTCRFLLSPAFEIPSRRKTVLDALRDVVQPVLAEGPVLVERWITGDGRRLTHLVNYGDAPVRVRLGNRPGRLLTPDAGTRIDGVDGSLVLDLWAVLEDPAPTETDP